MTVIPLNEEPPSYPFSYCEYCGKELDSLSIVVLGYPLSQYNGILVIIFLLLYR